MCPARSLTLLLLAAACSDALAQTDDWHNRPSLECSTDSLPHPPRPAGVWDSDLWPGGIVPYEFDANVSQAQADAFIAAMNELELVSAVDFVPRTNQPDAIRIQASTGNNSFVGRIGGVQPINIFNFNFRQIMAHELMHALGVWHEQSRNDRANFVTINYANICQTCCSGGPCDHNFDVRNGALHLAYDFDSCMHYGATAFSSNGLPTIEAVPAYSAFQGWMGQRNHLSHGDASGIASRYGPNPTGLGFISTPTNQSAPAGSTLVLSAPGRGPAPLFYQWRKDGVSLANTPGQIAGATTSTLTLNATDPADSGIYDVIISTGTQWTSSSRLVSAVASPSFIATIRCGSDFNIDGGVDGDDVIAFFAVWDAGLAAADVNTDGGVDGDDVIWFFQRWDAGC